MQSSISSQTNGPDTTAKPAAAQERLASLLALVAGYVDAAGYVKWKTYLSFMSGNTTQLGYSLSNSNTAIAATGITAIAAFVAGIFSGSCLVLYRNYKRAMMIWFVAGLLMLTMILSVKYDATPVLLITIMSFAMGAMNTVISVVGDQPVNTDFVTGTLSSMAKHMAGYSMSKDKELRSHHGKTAAHLFLIWLGFLLGALLGGCGTHLLNSWALLVPILLLLMATCF